MKVSVIGGGSTYTPELLEGLLERRASLDLDEVHLHDIDVDRLAILGPLAARMAERAAAPGTDPVRVRWGTDRRAAIADSTFVVSQLRVGGMAARERDEQLGRSFDLVGQETVGVGGLANAWRTVPVALSIARDVEETAPSATLLNFTNPAGLVTEALSRHSSVPTIGLCNIPWSVRAQVATWLDVDPASIQLESVGLNHLTWIRRVLVDGVDRTVEVLDHQVAAAERRAARSGASGDSGAAADRTDHRAVAEPRWSADELRELRALPNPYLRYFHHTDAWLERQRRVPTRAAEVARIERALLDTYADPELAHKPAELAERGGAHYSEAAAELMVDLVDAGRSTHRAVHVVNTANRGAIPGLADDVVVEVAAAVDRTGVVPLPVAPLADDVAELIRAVKRAELLAVDAAVQGDPALAIEALAAHPLGPSPDLAPAVWARLVEVHRGWLGLLG